MEFLLALQGIGTMDHQYLYSHAAGYCTIQGIQKTKTLFTTGNKAVAS